MALVQGCTQCYCAVGFVALPGSFLQSQAIALGDFSIVRCWRPTTDLSIYPPTHPSMYLSISFLHVQMTYESQETALRACRAGLAKLETGPPGGLTVCLGQTEFLVLTSRRRVDGEGFVWGFGNWGSGQCPQYRAVWDPAKLKG